MFSKEIIIVATVFILVSGGISWGFYRTNQKLKENLIETELRVENLSDTVIDMEHSRSNMITSIIEINRDINQISTETAENKNHITQTLGEHDLRKMVEKKASLVTRIVNRAVKSTMTTLEEITDPDFITKREIAVDVEALKKL